MTEPIMQPTIAANRHRGRHAGQRRERQGGALTASVLLGPATCLVLLGLLLPVGALQLQ